MAEYPIVDYPIMEPTVLPQPSFFTSEKGIQTTSESLFDIDSPPPILFYI